MSPIDELDALSVAATKRLAETFDAPDVIPFGSAALDLIGAHPELRRAFAQRLLEYALEPERRDPWFLQFCVHGLRWPELHSAFQTMHTNALAKNDWNSIPALAKALAAFDENWEDAKDFYGVYFHRERT
jgi:hypothetical protein